MRQKRQHRRWVGLPQRSIGERVAKCCAIADSLSEIRSVISVGIHLRVSQYILNEICYLLHLFIHLPSDDEEIRLD